LVHGVGFVGLAAVLGCSRGGKLATVSGVVTHNGTPVEGAKVTLHSTAEVNGKPGGSYAALTDSSGKYLIASVGKDPGIPPGLYKVTVIKLKGSGNLPPEAADPGQLEAAGAGPSVLNALPAEYATLATSKLSVTLEVGKNEGKNFDLKGQATASRPAGVP
jgi:hypothetical protein